VGALWRRDLQLPLDPINTLRDGYGMGLSVVQPLVKLLNLRLDVRSEVGKGSALFARAAVGQRPSRFRAPRGRAAARTPPRIDKHRVLLLEDDLSVRDVLAEPLAT
jgi:hypothetical protein